MASVTMTHPSLPEQPIEVDEVSVPHYQASGWQVAEKRPEKSTAEAKRRRPPKGDDS